MPDGGKLTIETANKWLDDRAARQHDLPVGQYVSICVTDTGTGMAPDVVAKAFEPFFTTKPLGQGTGLGLSMIYGFARQSGGHVRIYSEVGQGTTMCIYLPRHDEDAPSEDDTRPSTSLEPVGDGEVVLLIDDEPSIRMLVAEVLTEAGYAVIEAPDGPIGLRILESNTKIDLLITDVGLPGGMNGRQVADAARVSRPDLKVLFITGYAENAVVGGGRLEKGMFLLSKPFQVELLAGPHPGHPPTIAGGLQDGGPTKQAISCMPVGQRITGHLDPRGVEPGVGVDRALALGRRAEMHHAGDAAPPQHRLRRHRLLQADRAERHERRRRADRPAYRARGRGIGIRSSARRGRPRADRRAA